MSNKKASKICTCCNNNISIKKNYVEVPNTIPPELIHFQCYKCHKMYIKDCSLFS